MSDIKTWFDFWVTALRGLTGIPLVNYITVSSLNMYNLNNFLRGFEL